jgi:hypothetical protein
VLANAANVAATFFDQLKDKDGHVTLDSVLELTDDPRELTKEQALRGE